MKAISDQFKFLGVAMLCMICGVVEAQDHELPLKAALRSMNWSLDLGDFDLKLLVRRSSKSPGVGNAQTGRYLDGIDMLRVITLSDQFIVARSQGSTRIVVEKGIEDLQEIGHSNFTIGNGDSARVTSMQVGTSSNWNCPANGRSCFQTALEKWELSSLPLSIYFGESDSLKLVEELIEKLAELKPGDVRVDREYDDGSRQRVTVYRISVFYPEIPATNTEQRTRCLRMTVADAGEDSGLISEISQAWISGKHVKYVNDSQVNNTYDQRIRIKWRVTNERKLLQSVHAQKNPNLPHSSITNCTLEWKSFDKNEIKLPDAKGCETLCLQQRSEIDKLLKR